MLESMFSLVRPIVSAIKAALPFIRRGKAERDAGRNPHSVQRHHDDVLIESALRRLGTITPGDSLITKLVSACAGAIVRPEDFSKPYIREWLSHPNVYPALKRITRAKLVSAPEPTEDRETVISIYTDLSGEHKSYAESMLFVTVAFLAESTQQAASDAGVAAITQAGFATVHRRMDVQEQKLEELAGRQLPTNSAVMEHHGKDAVTVLEAILKRRALAGKEAVNDLRKLSRSVKQDGAFAAAPTSILALILDWTARIAASLNMTQEAEEAFQELNRMGHDATLPTTAWIETERGNIDAALRMLSSANTADCRSTTLGILRTKRDADQTLAYLDTLDLRDLGQFNAAGWTNAAGFLASQGRLKQATEILSAIPDKWITEWPLLGYMRGLIFAANLVAPDMRERVLAEDYLSASQHLLEGDEADRWRKIAESSFELCKQEASIVEDKPLVKRIEGWLRWLRLVDPFRREIERKALSVDMSEGDSAVELIAFAHTFDVDFDDTALSRRLDRSEVTGGMSLQELEAKIWLLRHRKRFSELAALIEDNRAKLLEMGSEAIVVGTLIEAHVRAGNWVQAEQIWKTSQSALHPSDVPRFEMMIAQGRGEDPTNQARELYEHSQAIEDLFNLVRTLETKSRWQELIHYASELFDREPNSQNALRKAQCMRRCGLPAHEILSFLESRQDLINRDEELQSLYAWILFHSGRVTEARKINDGLLEQRFGVNEVALDINLAVRSGDWERLPAILENAWTRRNELPTSLLLHLARLNSSRAPERAMQLLNDAVNKEPSDAKTLLQAHSVAISMGRDEVAMPLVARAAELSKDGQGPLVSLPFKEMVEMMRDQADDWQRKNELFRSGTVPIHWSAEVLNVPLAQLLISIPRENRSKPDARLRQIIPIRSGARQQIESLAVKKIALDITSVFVLGGLGFLDCVIENFEQTALPPSFMETLFYEEQKIRFHQPSRIAAAKPLLEMLEKGHLIMLEKDGPEDLAREVGTEMSALLATARNLKGVCVHSGKLYQIGSYMDVEADIGDFSAFLSSPAAIAEALYNEASITDVVKDKALQYFEHVSFGGNLGCIPTPGAAVLLDHTSVHNLAQAGLLERLVKSNRKIFVHAESVAEWRALVAAEHHSEATVSVLENIRTTISKGLKDGKVRFLQESSREINEERFGVSSRPMIELFEDVSGLDAVCIDDRMLNSQPAFEDRKGRRTLLLCSLDVIDAICAQGKISQNDHQEAIHALREGCLFTIPIGQTELFEHLKKAKSDQNGSLIESAHLKVIREYLARLHTSDFLCSQADLEYLGSLWRTGQTTVREIWSDADTSVTDAIARASWVVDNVIPDLESTLRLAPDGKERMLELATSRLFASLLPFTVPDDRREQCANWQEHKLVAPLLPANSQIVDETAKRIAKFIMERSTEIADEVKRHSS